MSWLKIIILFLILWWLVTRHSKKIMRIIWFNHISCALCKKTKGKKSIQHKGVVGSWKPQRISNLIQNMHLTNKSVMPLHHKSGEIITCTTDLKLICNIITANISCLFIIIFLVYSFSCLSTVVEINWLLLLLDTDIQIYVPRGTQESWPEG